MFGINNIHAPENRMALLVGDEFMYAVYDHVFWTTLVQKLEYTGITKGLFNIKMTSYQYRKSHCGDKTILRLSYLHNGIPYTGKMTSLFWIRALQANTIIQFNTIQFKKIFIASYNTKINTNRKKHETWGEKPNHNTAGEIEQHCVT